MGKWIVWGMFLFSFCKVISAEPYHVVLGKVAERMMSGIQQGQEDDLLASRDRCAPWCKGKQLFLNFYIKNMLSKQYVVELKDGVFLQDSVRMRDWTSSCIGQEEEKNMAELQRKKNCYSKISLKQQQEEIFAWGLKQEKKRIVEDYGIGARMVRSYGNSVPLSVGGRMIFFQCAARIKGRIVRFQVDISLFCDLDAWMVIHDDVWQEAEPYFAGVDVRNVGLLL